MFDQNLTIDFFTAPGVCWVNRISTRDFKRPLFLHDLKGVIYENIVFGLHFVLDFIFRVKLKKIQMPQWLRDQA